MLKVDLLTSKQDEQRNILEDEYKLVVAEIEDYFKELSISNVAK